MKRMYETSGDTPTHAQKHRVTEKSFDHPWNTEQDLLPQVQFTLFFFFYSLSLMHTTHPHMFVNGHAYASTLR